MSDKHNQHKSRYTTDRQIPGAFEGETVTRRRFMTIGSQAAGGVAAASFLLPALGFAIGPIFKEAPHTWETVGPTDMFPDNNYVPTVITLTPGIGEAGKATVYVRKRNPLIDTDKADRDTQFIAITSRCAHLGCPVRGSTPLSASSAPVTAASMTCSVAVWVGRRCVRSIASTRAS